MSKRTAPIDTEHTQYTQHQAKKQHIQDTHHIQPIKEIPNSIKRNREELENKCVNYSYNPIKRSRMTFDDDGYESDITMSPLEECIPVYYSNSIRVRVGCDRPQFRRFAN